MAKSKAPANDKGGKQGNERRNSQQTDKRNQHAIKKKEPRGQKKNGAGNEDNKKIHYVLHPKKIKEKMIEVKEAEKRTKEKSYLKEKRKRNAAFLKTTSKGQPVLNARMKILYNQIQKSFSGK